MVRGGAVVAAVLGGISALPASAVTVPLGTYTAALPLQPYPTVVSSTDPSNVGYPVTFTNTSPTGYLLSEVQVTLPAGFTNVGGATVSATGWSTSVNGNTVSASTASPLSSGIPSGGTVRLSFNATSPATVGSYSFVTAAQGLVASTGVAGDFANSGTDPQVSVEPYANVVTCSPSQVCNTGTVGSSTDTQASIVTTTGANQDVLGISVAPPTDQSCLSRIQPNSHSQQVTFNDLDLSRTLTQTLSIAKAVVDQQPNNGAGNYVLCYDAAGNTNHTTFVDSGGQTVTVGFLPTCSTAGLPAGNPCIESITKTQGGDLLITFTAPGGDPSNIAGISIG